MKILKLKFSNLNSLAGTWEIDFSCPTFTSSGIFLITGPTGSGKTTILDAISLALYGRTPRLGKVTKTNNHVMTRHTGECSAEVIFESQKGRFVCHWNQRRARNKPDGELQSPQHEISRADTMEILASKIGLVQEIVEEVTGMNYDQFTRSILLAQGGFAAFLQAGADERAPILEQITGTDIYSRLSIKAHERYSIERNKLDQLSSEVDSISVLSTEEKDTIEQQIEKLRVDAAGKDGEINRTTEAIRWVELVEKLRHEIEGLETDANHLAEKKSAFEPSRQKLLAAKRAASFQGLYTSLELKRDTLLKDTREHEQTVQQVHTLNTSLPGIESLVLTATTTMEKAEIEWVEGNSLIQIIRILDKQIRDKESDVHKERDALKELNDVLAGYKNKQEHAQKSRQEILNLKGDAVRYIDQNARDAAIRDIYSGTEQKICLIHNELDSVRKDKTDCKKQKELLVIKEHELAGLKKELDELKEALQKQEDKQKIREKELEKLLSGTSLSDLRKKHEKSKLRVDQLSRLKDVLAERTDTSDKLKNLEQTRDDLTHYLQISGYELDHIGTELRHHEELLETRRKAAFLAAKVRDFTEERSQLTDGKPCPLCGSLHHPFAAGLEIEPDEVISEFDEAEKTIRELTGKHSTLAIAIAGKKGELDRCIKDIADYDTKLKVLDNTWEEGTKVLCINTETDHSALSSYLETAMSELGVFERTLRDAEQWDEEIDKKAPLINSDRDKLTLLDKECREKEFQIESGKSRIEQQQERFSSGEKKIKAWLDKLKQDLSVLGYSIDSETNLNALLFNLKNRKEKYQEQENQIKRCEEQLQWADRQISGFSGHISEKTGKISGKIEEIKKMEQDLSSLKTERTQKFGERDPDKEEKRLKEAMSHAKELVDTRQKEKNDLLNQIRLMDNRRSDLERRISEAQESLRSDLEEFFAQIRLAGFADEETYKSALMKQEEISALEKHWEDIRTEETRILDRKSSAKGRYDDEIKKDITSRPVHELKVELESFQEERTQLIAEIGKNQEKLDRHEALLIQQGEKIALRDAQLREVDKWRRLYELIGSADGKKFRIFAQGLTFCLLLNHANQHLNRMTDRYILVQDKELPLDMQVIDTWQGSVIRSVKNLSGGEIFMVSLALALGLSQMASQNVRVDSLFLDEGFGTLDDDALETALCTLSGLEQEGKLIGVISHVSALKERIPVRISIEKGASGRSKIILPETG